MHATTEELPVLIENGPASVRATDWAGHKAIYVALPGGFDLTPLVEGLPDDRCGGHPAAAPCYPVGRSGPTC